MTPTELHELPRPYSVSVTETRKRLIPLHFTLSLSLSLTEGLLALPDSKNEDIFFTASQVPLARIMDERFIPQWMIAVLCERLTDFLVLSSFYMAGGAMRIEPPRSY